MVRKARQELHAEIWLGHLLEKWSFEKHGKRWENRMIF
jgi:hypothetical protein